MFLNQLESGNKELFLKVCVLASLSNGVLAEQEKEMIQAYCREMDIAEHMPDCDNSIEEIVEKLAKSTTNTEKNIILLEILGMLKVDGSYDNYEKKFMENLAKGLQVKEGMLNKINILLDKYTAVYKEMYDTICE
ncbi:hypothetical protein H2684_05275 [Clostridium sp. cel8]|uniref:hypothetical protein n=2 Tax=unclassified Clostridium TaxID=2614128 RepID=UPI0015F6D331|nr:hypothetical protein [Clostridium sp. cel8]MBA5850733.1 hypothetical protein [Clostridium sp. cel8]